MKNKCSKHAQKELEKLNSPLIIKEIELVVTLPKKKISVFLGTWTVFRAALFIIAKARTT